MDERGDPLELNLTSAEKELSKDLKLERLIESIKFMDRGHLALLLCAIANRLENLGSNYHAKNNNNIYKPRARVRKI